ncbi:hypothetical protein JD844_034022 [Phrynosoma platyrhinos]|uniref:Transducer of regulated CREB activity middle domain-containing protein n=1 Tax=Phrynosoma platyrhinos TaxID=52577 RepID=A0ABQ7T974_PHRPL|nr:hypothetical protein JD844_034022 [Phrynosoma platyrhinos]
MWSQIILSAFTATEKPVSTVGTEPWPVLWWIPAKCQSDWEQCNGLALSGIVWPSHIFSLTCLTHVDSCPYSTVYLSPPSDTSWRRVVYPFSVVAFFLIRTNSDSALHQSTMTPAQAEPFSAGSQDMQQKRGEAVSYCFLQKEEKNNSGIV